MTDYDDLLGKAQDEVPDEMGTGERFELPELETRKEGSKTVIEDFSKVADKLGRKEKHLSKYLQNEVGTAGHIDNGELVLNGEFRRGKIQSKLESYADKFVYCPECERPDTEIVKEKGVELLKCQACGARNPI